VKSTTIDLVQLSDDRAAYEVEQFVAGHPCVVNAQADFISDSVYVEHQDTLSHDELLDHVEHAGCTPSERPASMVDKLRLALK
jgi:hypothetical protein